MIKEIEVSEINEKDNSEEMEREQYINDNSRENWDLSGDILDCFKRYSNELSVEEQEEIIKGIEDGLTDQEIKRYFVVYGAEKMRQYRRVLTVQKENVPSTIRKTDRLIQRYGQNGYKNPVYVSYDERNKKYITTRFESRLNYISKEEFTFFEEKAKEDSSIQTFQIDEEAFLYLNFNETPQPSLRELEKMVKEIQVAEVNEEEEEKETDQQPDMLQDREQWDLSGDIIDCFRRYSSELSPEEQEEIIKGIEEGLTDQDVKRYFTLVGAEKVSESVDGRKNKR
ncbi:MAG: hypothetical protein KH078_12685 [Anaerobutyricum hallii]|uniref:hypothetical protein n=1 Tax=Anaerobutyricum hallii TaxID=39488 RepID=UPI001DA0D431|nr:hypothetical protein [Anaerobutyricum hallii]MBS7167664.1 hypothetical protein [Anaerobutyricum hallii]